MITLSLRLLGLLTACIPTIGAHSTEIISLKDAKIKFAENQPLLDQVKQRVCQYYEIIDSNNMSEHERDVQKVCDEALAQHFTNNAAGDNSAVIFDIDETLLSTHPICIEKNMEWTLDDAAKYRASGTSPAIKPMLGFLHAVKQRGYKIILLTARRGLLYQATYNNLINEGFAFDELILLPMELFLQNVSHGHWKTSVRKNLSEKYEIYASVGDSESDFIGGYHGIKIKLVNYLY